MPMDFTLDEEQTMLKDSASRFLSKCYDFEKRRKIVKDGGFDAGIWAAFAEMGWLGLAVPEDFSGLGRSNADLAIFMGEVGSAIVVEPLLTAMVLVPQLMIASDQLSAAEFLPGVIEGKLQIAAAISESEARGSVTSVVTRAIRQSNGWLLEGHKTMVVAAPAAEMMIASARTSGATTDVDGISLFLVPAANTGVEISSIQLSDGSRAGDVRFSSVLLPHSALLGHEGAAFPALRLANAHALLAVCAEAIGAMEKAMWITRDYLQTRQQFGVTLGSFQALQHKMADMLIELELSRSMVFRALAFFDQDAEARDHALSLTKMQIGKSAKYVGGQAIQLHGGIGVTDEYLIGHYFKRLIMIENLFGNSSFHAERVANKDIDVLGERPEPAF